MAGGCAWSRRLGARQRSLRTLVRDTQRALQEVSDILTTDPEIPSIVSEIGSQATRPTALVVLGTTTAARVRLLHALLGRQLLPEDLPRGSRWIRIQFGASTQVHLSLGNSEFELVEELHCNKTPWDVLPVEDLLRQDTADLATILEVEINNPFLKDGLRIILPPDITPESAASSHLQLKSMHSELYSKRSSILKSFHPVYLYAIDRIGKNIFCDNICDNMAVSRSEEDFWSTFNLYETKWGGGEGGDKCGGERGVPWAGRGEPAVFNAENCLDLHQVKEVDPHSQVLFIMFSDAEELETISSAVHADTEATESTGKANYCSEELPEADQGLIRGGICRNISESPECKLAGDSDTLNDEHSAFMNELLDQWELMSSPPLKHYVHSQWAVLDTAAFTTTAAKRDSKRQDKLLKSRTALLSVTLKFATDCLQTCLLQLSTRLSEVHVKLLQQFILASFDMARELQVVPKKIQYVAMQEQHLYDTINEKFAEGDKKQELVQMMQEVLQEIRADVVGMDWSVDDLPWHQDQRFMVSNSTFYSSTRDSVSLSPSHRLSPSIALSPSLASEMDASDGEEASDTCWLEEYDVIASSEESYSDYYTAKQEEQASSPQASTIRVENEELSSLSHTRSLLWSGSDVTACTNSTAVSVKHATLDVQRTVLSRLSRKISLKLVKFVDCLKETYFGTLQRCVESLEESCRRELGGRPASEAVRRLLAAGRRVELQPGAGAAASLARSLLDSLRRLLHKLRLAGAGSERAPCCVLSAAWRRRVALHTAHSLSAPRLARLISQQIVERLRAAHDAYQAALCALQAALASRLHHTEDVKLAVRKKYAPMFARLCLESTSMCDLLMYGIPDLGREIGRGQYGVVYAGRGGWGGHAPVAVKSVLPADERHYHELAMEFFYTRSIPAHPRIVRLFGSIVQKGAGGAGGGGRSVLLVSERAARDLHAAVRAGLGARARMRVACDIVQGIRYLHSLGLVHRDIKLKNVLLDAQCRASLSDLGFCSYGALMSGSVVGTPIHMAPELFNGDYSAMVDVYAFGILFWYLCAGDVKLPAAFEAFHNKEQLWSKVKKGLRPERLPQFTDECWQLMQECWHQEPAQRALPGDLQPRLVRILQHTSDTQPAHTHNIDDDSLYTTGVYD